MKKLKLRFIGKYVKDQIYDKVSLTYYKIYEGDRWNQFCYSVVDDSGEPHFYDRSLFEEVPA